jgi:hypothetical protein
MNLSTVISSLPALKTKNFTFFFRKAWEAVVSVDGAGTTNRTGTYEILDGQQLPIVATADLGHIFLYWTLDGKIISTATSVNVPDQEGATSHEIVAHFL